MGTTGDTTTTNKSIKRPHAIKTLLFDRYWKRYFEAWNDRAQQVYEKKYELQAQMIELDQADDEAIEHLYELHLDNVRSYEGACKEKDPDTARDYVDKIRKNANQMDDLTKCAVHAMQRGSQKVD
ncbi:hypothetical protein EST38_g4934 [Candolleomyces aberdarensis]|uniref:Uncharacterized protein n=1 Tax=Candolleomyces aberdarensis TaxID=2316362 RepID=A0A4Q2DP25_9AGAR|nr:hypothetical protein EST38_g4934 [Candolleomyces aberdarensis]